MPQIIVYSGPLCSGCDEVKGYLAEHAIPFEERNIRANIETMIEFRRKGRTRTGSCLGQTASVLTFSRVWL